MIEGLSLRCSGWACSRWKARRFLLLAFHDLNGSGSTSGGETEEFEEEEAATILLYHNIAYIKGDKTTKAKPKYSNAFYRFDIFGGFIFS